LIEKSCSITNISKRTLGLFLLTIKTKVSSSVVETINWLGDLPQIFFDVIPASFKIK